VQLIWWNLHWNIWGKIGKQPVVFLALRATAEKVLERGGRVIGTGSEGNLVCPNREHVIAGGVAGMFAAGTTPAAFRVLLRKAFPLSD